jgi:hypothetical protein
MEGGARVGPEWLAAHEYAVTSEICISCVGAIVAFDAFVHALDETPIVGLTRVRLVHTRRLVSGDSLCKTLIYLSLSVFGK